MSAFPAKRAALTILVLAPFIAVTVFLLTKQETTGTGDIPIRAGQLPVLTEFADFQCIHCATFALSILPVIDQELVRTGRLEYEYRHYPFLGPESQRAAEAAECAKDQGRFQAYHDALFVMTYDGVTLDDDNLTWAAEALRLDPAPFTNCLTQRVHQETVDLHREQGRRMGVQGTPTLFLNDQVLRWDTYLDLRSQIDIHLAESEASGE